MHSASLLNFSLLIYQTFHCLPLPRSSGIPSVVIQFHSSNKAEMSEHLQTLKDSLDAFALDLYHEIAKNPSTAQGNLFMSPLSISSALLLVYLGAKGNTKAELDALLHFQKHFAAKQQDLLVAYEEVLRVFVPPKDKKGEDAYSLSLANKAYIHNELEVKPDYLQLIKKHLHSEVAQVNFKDFERVRQEINAWVEKQTQNKIKDLLAVGAINAATEMALVNAIYFKANWLNKFKEADTKKENFQNLDGRNSLVDMMFLGGKKYFYYDNFASSEKDEIKLPAFQLVNLPYQQNEMSMLVLLPQDKNGIVELETALTAEQINHILQRTYKQELKLWLPRFKLEQTIDLMDTLSHLGVQHLFGDADLSGIAAGLTVSSAVHKAFVEVNEEGTEAAAATAVMMTRSLAMDPKPPVEFRADHPFVFAIRHEGTGLLTFLGRIAKM